MTRSHNDTDERGDSHGQESSQGWKEEGSRQEAVTAETRSPWGAKVCAPVFCTPLLHAVPHAHAPHDIVLPELLDDLHPADDLSEHRVATIEVRLRTVRHEVLAPGGVLPVERHTHRAAQVRAIIDLVTQGVPGPARAVAARIPVLQYERRHHAVDAEPVEESLPRERDETVDRQGRIEHRELHLERALVRV